MKRNQSIQKQQHTCPYCGSPAFLRPAGDVYGYQSAKKGSHLYVCSRWPECDSYVSAYHVKSQPKGTLANKALRIKRIEAHRALEKLRRKRHMDKWAVYLWMQMKLNLPPGKAHISTFSMEMCNRLISVCRKSLQEDHIRLT